MIKTETIILERMDLSDYAKNKHFVDIDFNDFNSEISLSTFQTTSLILFLDNDSKTKIIKNRFGNKCENKICNIKDKLNDNLKSKNIEHYVSLYGTTEENKNMANSFAVGYSKCYDDILKIVNDEIVTF